MNHPEDIKQAPSVFVTTLRQFTTLMQDEIALARAEFSTSLSRASAGLAMIGVAALMALVALNVLAGALVGYLTTTGLGTGTAALLVGGGLLALALAILLVGKSRLTPEALVPDRTTDNLKRDFAQIKDATDA